MKNYKLSPAILLLILLISGFSQTLNAQNQAGTLDATFGTGGEVVTYAPPQLSRIDLNDFFLQADGKILALGKGDGSGGFLRPYLALYNSNGSFEREIVLAPPFPDFYVYYFSSLAIQPDGKFILGGAVRKYRCPLGFLCSDLLLVRYHPGGAIDTSFGAGGMVIQDLDSFEQLSDDGVSRLLLQPDGKIIVIGSTLSIAYGGANEEPRTSFAIQRFYPNGSRDTSFGDAGIVTVPHILASNQAVSGALQSDGKLLVSGFTEMSFQHKRSVILVRYNADGSLDSAFAAGGVLRLSGNTTVSVITQPDGRILWLHDARVHRIHAGGELDFSFQPRVLTVNGGIVHLEDFALQPDGKIIVGGRSYSPGFQQLSPTVARFLANGELDTTFGSGGIAIKPITPIFYGERVRLQPDGKIILAGELNRSQADSRFALYRFMGDTNFFEQQTEKSRAPSLLTGLD